jgi:hypothetical protein
LTYIKDTLEKLSQVDLGYYQRLVSTMSPEEHAKFTENMSTAQALKEREAVVTKQIEEFEEKTKN